MFANNMLKNQPQRHQPRPPPPPPPPPKVPNVKFNVARMLERMAPLTDRTVVEQQIKPTLQVGAR